MIFFHVHPDSRIPGLVPFSRVDPLLHGTWRSYRKISRAHDLGLCRDFGHAGVGTRHGCRHLLSLFLYPDFPHVPDGCKLISIPSILFSLFLFSFREFLFSITARQCGHCFHLTVVFHPVDVPVDDAIKKSEKSRNGRKCILLVSRVWAGPHQRMFCHGIGCSGWQWKLNHAHHFNESINCGHSHVDVDASMVAICLKVLIIMISILQQGISNLALR